MKVCFPVQKDNGIDSTVYGHFGSAPAFVIVDTDEANAAQITTGSVGYIEAIQHRQYT